MEPYLHVYSVVNRSCGGGGCTLFLSLTMPQSADATGVDRLTSSKSDLKLNTVKNHNPGVSLPSEASIFGLLYLLLWRAVATRLLTRHPDLSDTQSRPGRSQESAACHLDRHTPP